MLRLLLSLLFWINPAEAILFSGGIVSTGILPIGMNLNQVAFYTPEQPFLNILKTGGGWSGNLSSGTPCVDGSRCEMYEAVFNLDANGYPTNLSGKAGSIAAGLTFSQIDTLVLRDLGIKDASGTQSAPFYTSGQYLFLYDGAGTITYAFDATKNAGLSGVGRDVLDVVSTSAGIQIKIAATDPLASGNYLRNMRLLYCGTWNGSSCSSGYETLLAGGEIFDPTFYNRFAMFKTFRFMDWNKTNSNPASDWSLRPTLTQVFWGITESFTQSNVLQSGVPIEAQVALCNKASADCWFNMPFYSTDAYVASEADLVFSILNSNLNAYVEYGNELWNSSVITGTLQTGLVTLSNTAFSGQTVNPADALGTDFGKSLSYGVFRGVKNGDAWKTAFGAESSRVIRIGIGGQAAFAVNRNSSYILGLGSSLWSGLASTHMDAFSIAPYFGNTSIFPTSWSADADNGLSKMYTETVTGGLIPTGSGASTTTGTSTSYALTSGLSLPSTPSNQTMISFKVNVNNGNSPSVIVDSGNSFPILNNNGTALTAAQLTTSGTYVASFTSATSAGSVTAGWRVLFTVGITGGILSLANTWTAQNAAIVGSLPLITYEGGQHFTSSSVNTVLTSMLMDFNRNNSMGTIYSIYLNGLKASGVSKFVNFNSVFPSNGASGFWGSLDNVLQTSSPKYNALVNGIAP